MVRSATDDTGLMVPLKRAAACARLQALANPSEERREQLARILHALVRAAEGDESLKAADLWAQATLNKHSKVKWILETESRNPFPRRSVAVERLTKEAEFYLRGDDETEEILGLLVVRAASIFLRLAAPVGSPRIHRSRSRARFLKRDPEILVREALRRAGMPPGEVRSIYNYLAERTKRPSATRR